MWSLTSGGPASIDMVERRYLLDTAGHVIHIDFGFVFGVGPGGSFSLEMSTPFKLTEEMIEVMNGLRSSLFSEFVTLFCCGFLALQPHCDTFMTLVEVTARYCTLKCFEGRDTAEIVGKLQEVFAPNLAKGIPLHTYWTSSKNRLHRMGQSSTTTLNTFHKELRCDKTPLKIYKLRYMVNNLGR